MAHTTPRGNRRHDNTSGTANARTQCLDDNAVFIRNGQDDSGTAYNDALGCGYRDPCIGVGQAQRKRQEQRAMAQT